MGGKAIRVGGVTALAVAAWTAGVTPVAAQPADPGADCAPRQVHTVASGLGVLENLAFDGRGRLLVSETDLLGGGALRSITPDGTVDTAVADVASPGGIVVDDATAYFTTGNGFASGALGRADGTLDALDLDTGERRTVATGLVMPNGLVRLPDGDFLVTRDIGTTGLTEVPADGSAPTVVRTDLGSVNGIAVHGDHVYVGTTFEAVNKIHVLDADDLAGPVRSIDLPGFGTVQVADDLAVGPDGAVYHALNVAGEILRVDPETGQTCTIATGVPLVSSVAFGEGPGWDPDTLYTTGFDGTVRAVLPE